jgi:4-hydroxy-tetrahydrodipicolinate reductase
MKIALLGKGKTGGRVLELLVQKEISYTVFDSANKPTKEKLLGHDVIISFYSGEVFKEYLDICIESKIPLVCGSTGFKFPENLNQTLIAHNTKWIYATNFSLGMNLVQQMILILKEASKIFTDYKFSLHEVHHTKKLDAPSGTALSWKTWANHEMEITSERTGDVIGIHELKLTTANEEILLKHTALDRKIFAEGALFAAEKILKDPSIKPGLHLFQDIVQSLLTQGLK